MKGTRMVGPEPLVAKKATGTLFCSDAREEQA